MLIETFETNTVTREIPAQSSLISWRSTLGGLALAAVTFLGALALAVAFGGIGLEDGATARNAGIFAGVSVVVATILATFVGAYYAVRTQRTRVDIVGSAQGLLVGAVFMTFVVVQVFALAGTLGSAAAKTLGASAAAVTTGAAVAADNPMVREFVEDNFAGLNLRSEPSVVIQGVASRLLRGDNEAAKNYLAGQAGLTPEEADARIAAMQGRIDAAAVEAREAAATALKATGWSLFIVMSLGLMFSVLGGLLASVLNTRATMEVVAHARQTKATTRPAHV